MSIIYTPCGLYEFRWSSTLVRVTFYPAKGQRGGWPRCSSFGIERARTLYRRVKAQAI